MKMKNLEQMVVYQLSVYPLRTLGDLVSDQSYYTEAEYTVALDKLIEQNTAGTCHVSTPSSTVTVYYLKAEEEMIRDHLRNNGALVVEAK